MNIDGLFNVSERYAKNFWRSQDEPGGQNMPSPLGPATHRQFFRQQHSLALQSTSNIWLRNASVRYNIPERIAATDVTVHVTGQNLFVITDVEDFNPDAEVNTGSGTQFGTLIPGSSDLPFPLSRTLTFGLDIQF
jgi:hypothetical protein